jgi:hypothetical protein
MPLSSADGLLDRPSFASTLLFCYPTLIHSNPAINLLQVALLKWNPYSGVALPVGNGPDAVGL